ncbi:ribonuclease H-like domain-containing protein [Tanacetum coccineum]
MAFVSSPGNTNETDTANIQVNTVSTPLCTASTHDDTAKLSDATVYAFLANQPNGSHLVYEDLEQIHEDDLKEMDLKWQLALLSIRARKFYQRTGKKITINGSDTAGYDKSKVECFNCHKMGHFARECRDTSSKAMVAFDGAGFDWSFMTEEEVLTNITLMAFSDSEYDNLRIEFNKSEFDLATYKRGLASVEEQLVFYMKNEPEFEGYGVKVNKSVCENSSNEIKKTTDAPIIEDWVFDCDEDESEVMKLKSDNVQPKPKKANEP